MKNEHNRQNVASYTASQSPLNLDLFYGNQSNANMNQFIRESQGQYEDQQYAHPQ